MSLTSTPASRISFAIVGMSCGHCVQAVRRALFGVPGIAIESVAVGSAVLMSPSVEATEAAIAAIKASGYSAKVLPDRDPAEAASGCCCAPGAAPCR